jgi:hypothetical protein
MTSMFFATKSILPSNWPSTVTPQAQSRPPIPL